MIRFLVVCTNGLGTSLMIRLNLQTVLAEIGLPEDIEHTDVSSVHLYQPEVIIGDDSVVDSIRGRTEAELISLAHIADRAELKQAILSSTSIQHVLK